MKLKSSKLIKKRNDSIKRARTRLNKLEKRKTDSIQKSSLKHGNKTKNGFFNNLFKKRDK